MRSSLANKRRRQRRMKMWLNSAGRFFEQHASANIERSAMLDDTTACLQGQLAGKDSTIRRLSEELTMANYLLEARGAKK